MKRQTGLSVAVAATGMFMAGPVFAQMSAGLAIEHPALFPFNLAGTPPAGVTERTTTRASVASAAGEVGGLWHHPLYPFLVAGVRSDVTRVDKRAQEAAADIAPAVWHPAMVPFSIGGR